MLRAAIFVGVDMLCAATSARQRVGAWRGQQQPPQLPQRPRSGGSVASSPGAGRMQPEAARGDREAMRGGLAHSLGVDGRFGRICTICHVRGSGNVNMLVTPRHVNACIQRVHVDVQTLCNSLASAHVLALRSASENAELDPYEG